MATIIVEDGTGLVNKPPWVAGDQHEWSSTRTGPWPCKACTGSGLLTTSNPDKER